MSKDELSVTNEEAQLNLFRSVYYQLNAKPDTMSKAFAKSVIVTREDILELNSRIKEKIKLNYADDGYIASVVVNLKNKKSLSFSCWDEFIQYRFSESTTVNSILLQWNFNIRIPAYQNPQNHNLVVKISNGLKTTEVLNLIFSGNLEDVDEVEMGAFPVVAKVDFIQAVFGEELINIVADWVNGLKRNLEQRNPFILFLRKYRKRVAQYFEYILYIVTFLMGILVITKHLDSLEVASLADVTMNQVKNTVYIVVGFYLIMLILKKFYLSTAHNVYNRLEEYGRGYVFYLTKGDQQYHDELLNKDKTNANVILLKVLISCIFNIACGVIATLLL